MLSMGHFARDIAARLHLQASYFSEEHVDRLMADLRELAQIDWSAAKDAFTQRKADLILAYGYDPSNVERKPFAFLDQVGAAIIPVHGMLINRFSGSYSSVTGYNFIRSQRLAALADPDVKLIVYDYNTYGGTCAGCGELSNEMYQDRNVKPSLGIIDASCYSAGYNLGSANSRLVASPSSGTGSIGAISMHVDLTEMLKEAGVKITLIRSAERKMEGNPFEPLSDRTKKSIQASVDYHASAFIENVVRNRGMEEAEVRATEARCFDPPEALETGLIDAIQPPADAITSYLDFLNGGTSTMTTANQGNGNTPAPMTAEQIQQTIAASIASALPTALAAHDKAKTERRAAIMGCDEAKKRQKFAAHLADNTSMTVDEAKALLAVSAEEQPERRGNNGTGRSPFHQAMDTSGNPHVGADGPDNGGGDGDGGGDGQESDVDAADRILGLYGAHTGNKVIPIKKRA